MQEKDRKQKVFKKKQKNESVFTQKGSPPLLHANFGAGLEFNVSSSIKFNKTDDETNFEKHLIERWRKTQEEDIPTGLYLLPTPLGNLGDMSLRFLHYLQAMDCLACEDTRVSRKLLSLFSLKKEVFTSFEHNACRSLEMIIRRLEEGKKVGLLTDAGTPAISDPGAFIVSKVREKGYNVHSLPGPCAAIVALSGSGFPSEHFSFHGFPPRKKQERLLFFQQERENLEKQFFKEGKVYTHIYYEAPHRLKACLQALCDAGLSKEKLCLARELSKRYEEWESGTVEELYKEYLQKEAKGEYVLLLSYNDKISLEERKNVLNPSFTRKNLLSSDKVPTSSSIQIFEKLLVNEATEDERKSYLQQELIEGKKIGLKVKQIAKKLEEKGLGKKKLLYQELFLLDIDEGETYNY